MKLEMPHKEEGTDGATHACILPSISKWVTALKSKLSTSVGIPPVRSFKLKTDIESDYKFGQVKSKK